MLLTKEQVSALPDDGKGSAIYFLWLGDAIQYIGKTKNVNSRLYFHHCSKIYGNRGGTYNVSVKHDRATVLKCEPDEMGDLERAYIAFFQPPLNKNLKGKRK